VALWLGETGITIESTNETRGDRLGFRIRARSANALRPLAEDG